MALLVPPPSLTQDSTIPASFGFNRPIDLTCTGIAFPDGRPLVFDNARDSGFLLYRQTGQGAVMAWDDQAGLWVAPVPEPEPQPLLYHDDVWKSILVPLGEKDSNQQDKFVVPPAGSPPSYYVRCFFAGKDVHGEWHEGASPPSNVIQLDSAAASAGEIAGIVFEPPDLKAAEHVGIFLSHPTLGHRAELSLDRVANGVTATLTVTAGAVTVGVRIDASGVHVRGPVDLNGFAFP
jgi:hypothetical protein